VGSQKSASNISKREREREREREIHSSRSDAASQGSSDGAHVTCSVPFSWIVRDRRRMVGLEVEESGMALGILPSG
jgi:hypothetical protein